VIESLVSFTTAGDARFASEGSILLRASVRASASRKSENNRKLGRDAFGMSAGRFTTTFRPPYVFVDFAAKGAGPEVAVALGVFVGWLGAVAEGLAPGV